MSGRRWNGVSDAIVAWALQKSDELVAEMLADGYPPGAEPADDYAQFRTLQAMAEAGDPRFWDNRDAQQRLTELTFRFGQAGEIQQALAAPIPLLPGGLARASWFAGRDAAPGG